MVNTKKGFTLIELLIVIAIVALLMMLGATNWITQQKRARDARRMADLEQIRSALEMYRTDNPTYPYVVTAITPEQKYEYMESVVAPEYIQEMPKDPQTEADYYYDTPDGKTYDLGSNNMEMQTNPYIVNNP